MKVRSLGVWPKVQLETPPVSLAWDSMKSQDGFNQVVTRGVPGTLMPGFSQLSAAQLSELYGFMKSKAQ